MSEGSPLWGAGKVRPKTSASGTELYKIIYELHPQCKILRKAKPLAQIDEIACMPRVCLSNRALGTPVFVHQTDSKAKTKSNCKKDLLVTENLFVGKECP